ncbi:MAG: TonB-dependent receptor, partial [Pedosphaera sp.]|nr:TonB-dependent receptor [Pedosphaera sp.]
RDIGIKLNLGRRIYLNALSFDTSATNDFANSAGPHGYFNTIWDSLFAAGKITAAQDTANQTQTNGNTFDSTSKGYEVELIGDITKQWRVFANYSDSVLKQTNIGTLTRAYLDAHRAEWLQGDNGRVLINGTGQLAPVVDDGDALVETVGEAIIDADRQVFDLFILPDGQKPRGQIQRKMNLRTTYAFDSGFLRGVSFGGGVRYQSAPITNYIITGTSTTGVTSRLQMVGKPNSLVDLNVAKGGRAAWMGRNVRWSLQLNVNNLLNNQTVLPTRLSSTGQTISYRLQDPTEFIVTGKFTF